MVVLVCCQFAFHVAQYKDGGDSNDRVCGVGEVLHDLVTICIQVVRNIAWHLEAVKKNGKGKLSQEHQGLYKIGQNYWINEHFAVCAISKMCMHMYKST